MVADYIRYTPFLAAMGGISTEWMMTYGGYPQCPSTFSDGAAGGGHRRCFNPATQVGDGAFPHRRRYLHERCRVVMFLFGAIAVGDRHSPCCPSRRRTEG